MLLYIAIPFLILFAIAGVGVILAIIGEFQRKG